MEYRPFPEERSAEFSAFMRYAFSPQEGPYDPESDDDDREHLADYRGLFDGDDPVAVCGHHDFTLRVRGRARDVAGLSAVASPPEHRRQGNVRRLLRESLGEYRADGTDVSVLWPFEYGFYRKYGWATVSRYRRVTTPPGQLDFVDDAVATGGEAAGRYRRLDADDYAAARSVLSAMADRYDFTMDRTAAWWRERTLRGWGTDPFVYGWERDGDLRAFWSYVFDDEGGRDDDVLRVTDVAVADEEAWLQALRFFRNHDSQVGAVQIRAPPDADLLDRVADPRAVTVEERTGPMIRLVDVASAFEWLSPDAAVDAEFTLAVDDPLVGWNDRAFRVDVADGVVRVDPLAADGGDARDADASAGIGTISQVYAGYHSVGEAIRRGDLTVADEGVADGLGDLFPPRLTHLREAF